MEKEAYQKEIQTLKEQLAAKERLNQELIELQNQNESLEFSWSGNLGHWFWDYPTNTVTFNSLKAEAIGYKEEELDGPVDYQFFTDKLHPDDYDYVMDVMVKHLKGEVPVWEVKYRIQHKDGSWKTFYDRGKVTQRDEEGKPLFLSGIVFDVTEHENEKMTLIEENRKMSQQAKLDSLTGLYNRLYTLYYLGLSVSEAKEKDTPFSVVMLQMCDLEKQRQRYGRFFANEIQKTVGKLISQQVSENDAAGMLGEGEFLILLNQTTYEEARAFAGQLRDELYTVPYSRPVRLTINAGIVQYEKGETVGQLVERVEEDLLYHSN